MVEGSTVPRRIPGLNLAYHPTKIGRRRRIRRHDSADDAGKSEKQMKTSLPQLVNRTAMGPLDKALASFPRRYPAETGPPHPVPTVYAGAHLFQPSTARR